MAKNCCTFTSKFCTQSGQIVVGRMKLQDGNFSIEYYDLSGALYTGNDIIFPTCQAITPTNFVDTEVTFLNIVCDFTDTSKVRCEVWVSDIAALKNGSLIELNIIAVSDILGSITSFKLTTPPLSGVVESSGKLLVTDVSLIAGQSIMFYIENLPNVGCNATYSVDAVVDNISNLSSTCGNGTHSGNNITG